MTLFTLLLFLESLFLRLVSPLYSMYTVLYIESNHASNSELLFFMYSSFLVEKKKLYYYHQAMLSQDYCTVYTDGFFFLKKERERGLSNLLLSLGSEGRREREALQGPFLFCDGLSPPGKPVAGITWRRRRRRGKTVVQHSCKQGEPWQEIVFIAVVYSNALSLSLLVDSFSVPWCGTVLWYKLQSDNKVVVSLELSARPDNDRSQKEIHRSGTSSEGQIGILCHLFLIAFEKNGTCTV